MRIFFISSYPTPGDGVSDYTGHLIKALQQADHQVSSGRVNIQLSPMQLFKWGAVYTQILEFKPDVVHIQYTPTTTGPGIRKLMKRLQAKDIRCILTIHEKPDFFIGTLPQFLVQPFLHWEKNILQQADAVIVHTKDHYIDLRLTYRIPEERVQVIPHFIQDIPVTGTFSSPRIIAFGRIVPKKRLDVVLEALPEILKTFPHLQLLVIGTPPKNHVSFYQHLKTLSKQLRVEPHVQWLGYIPVAELRPLLAPTDVGILPYMNVTQSGAAFTLLSLHIPIITNDLRPFNELFAQYAVGKSIPLQSAKDIAHIIIQWFQDSSHAKPWEKEIQRLKNDQSLATIAQRHTTLYKKICQNTLV